MSELNRVQGVNLTLRRALAEDARVILQSSCWVSTWVLMAGMFRATDGLFPLHGSDRVLDTPIAEASTISVSIGLAAQGFRPVAEIQFTRFTYACIDQLLNRSVAHAHTGAPKLKRCSRQPNGRY